MKEKTSEKNIRSDSLLLGVCVCVAYARSPNFTVQLVEEEPHAKYSSSFKFFNVTRKKRSSYTQSGIHSHTYIAYIE